MTLEAEDIRNEKVKVLRSMKPVKIEDVVLGQYTKRVSKAHTYPGYLDDPTVPKNRCMPHIIVVLQRLAGAWV